MKTSDFDYQLPPDLIAHEPAKDRDHSRLMILDRSNQSIEHKHFFDIVDYLQPRDLLVLNDTKVIPARLIGKKIGGSANVEVFLICSCRPACRQGRACSAENETWKCLVKPGKRLKVGSKVSFGDGQLVGTVLEKLESGEQIIHFESKENFWQVIYQLGQVPLPPYIKTRNTEQETCLPDGQAGKARNRYQTVYARKEGASAAPTAGLHFTPELLEKVKKKGVGVAYLTLHTGLGTFQPVRTEEIEDHPMHEEYFEIPDETLKAVMEAKRVIAVGTTCVRALESGGHRGNTRLFIKPGYKFKVVDAMITNFHWPKSTLIMLVSAFAGKDFIMKAYQEAIKEKYRFYSFGDAMFIS